MKPAILDTIPGYSGRALMGDALAGVSVAMVALPLSLAIAIASGATPAQGLVTAVVGGLIISALGGSRVQIGGPTGAFIVVVYGVIATYGMDGLILATGMAGVILLLAGLLRAGTLVGLVPEPVVNGFTIGIGIIIATSQVPDLLGIDAKLPAAFIGKVQGIWEARAGLRWQSLAVGLTTMVAIIALRRALPRFPGMIVAVAATSALALLLPGGVETILSRFGALPDRLPMPSLPEISWARITELLPAAMIIAFLAGVESLLSALVADRMTGQRHRPNAEVLAQGTANIASCLMGGLPATGAIARTATSIRAGGKTPVAGIVHALAILAMMMLAAPLVSRLAMPALAGLLMLTAWKMSEPHKWRGYASGRRSDQVLLVMTLLLTVLVDLTTAIGVGTAAGLALRLRRRDVSPADWEPPER